MSTFVREKAEKISQLFKETARLKGRLVEIKKGNRVMLKENCGQ
jgi:hypothetical protein